MDKNGYYDQNGDFNIYPNSYTNFFEMIYSIVGFFVIIGILLYSVFTAFLIFLLTRLFHHKRMKLREKQLKMKQSILTEMDRHSKRAGLFLYDGTFVPKSEYEGCCIECLLLTKQLVSPSVCGELEIHKMNCSPVSDYKLQNNATYI